MDNYSKDVLSEIQERAFSEGYNQALIEKMYAEEGAKEKEAILDRLKRYGGKVKDFAWGDKWEGNKLRRGVTIGTGVGAAGLGTLAYLKHKKAKAEAAAEALEEAAEAQREYSAILSERIYSEEEKSGYGKAAGLGALGAAGVAGLGYGAGKGIQKLSDIKNEKIKDALSKAGDIKAYEEADKLKKAYMDSRLKKTAGYLTEKEAALADLWKSGKAGKAKILGAAGLALGAGAGIGAGVKKLKDKKNED